MQKIGIDDWITIDIDVEAHIDFIVTWKFKGDAGRIINGILQVGVQLGCNCCEISSFLWTVLFIGNFFKTYVTKEFRIEYVS